jgi:uncharacterized delta-60 repeat protein
MGLQLSGSIQLNGSINSTIISSSFFGDLTVSSVNGSKDTEFDNSTGFNNSISDITIDSNDKIYVVGFFTTYKGVAANRIIRLNPDGSKDTGFDNSTGFDGGVNTIAIDSNGKIYIGGSFSTYKGVAANRIIRLNPDGSKDTGFDNSTGFNNTVNTITTDSNGKIYVGGVFSSYKGVEANEIIRLNPDGSKDTEFDNSTGFNDDVVDIEIDSNGKIYVGGGFTTYKGVTENRIIRLNPDGSKDTGFDNSTGFNGIVNDIAIDSNGKIYVGGFFTTYKGASANRIIRLNPDGSKDTGFDNSTGFNSPVGLNMNPRIITIDSNGKIYVGGGFSTYKGVSANGIIRLNPDGSKDTGFDNSTGFNGVITDIAIDSNGKIYVGGGFSTYKGVSAINIIRLNTTFIPFISTTALKDVLDNPIPTFPFTGSANISGSANINASLLLSRVSSSFNFANDAAAQSAGIPLGGLYHTSGSIKIRLV